MIATSVKDGEGRKAWNHTGPMPAQVSRLAGPAYLIEDGGPSSETLCPGATSDRPPVSVNIPKLHATYVKCGRVQTWNDHRAGSMNWAHSFTWIMRQPITGTLIGFLTIICLGPGLWSYGGDLRRRRRTAAANREHQVTALQKARDQRQQLTQLWAEDKLSDVDYDKKLDEVYQRHPELLMEDR